MSLTNRLQKTEVPLSEIEALFETYVKEIRYLRNFSENTLVGYRESFRRWQKYADGIPTKEKLTDFLVGMRQSGISPVTCNISIRAFNAFLTWLSERKVVSSVLRIKKLPEEKRKMHVCPEEDIRAILAFKPKGINEKRIYAMGCLFIDTGLRFSEAAGIQTKWVSFDNLSITVLGSRP